MWLVFSFAWLVGVAGLLLYLLRQSSGYNIRWRRINPKDALLPTVTVVVPARNEARNIERCVSSLMQQSYPFEKLRIVVVDDNSSDGTGDIVRRLAVGDRRVQVLQGRPLPEGWMGKQNACAHGSQAAASEWLCFVDADTAARPDFLRRAIALAQRRDIDLLSLLPYQKLETFWERLILPTQFLLFSLSMDIHRINDPRTPDAVANGQCIFIRREVYDRIGGHGAVRSDILEDVALARVVKSTGHRLYVKSGADLIRTRMYNGLKELWGGFSKNSVDLVGGISRAIVGALGMLALGWVPVIASALVLERLVPRLLSGQPAPRLGLALGLLVLGTAAVVAAHALMARFNRMPMRYSLLFPISHTLAAALTLNSVRRYLSGRNEWKGRVYAVGSTGS